MLKITEVGFRYSSDGPAYRFDLKVGPGQIVGLTGRSGAGKSTLLDLIAGFLSGEDGAIEVDGQEISALPPDRRPLTILFQRHNLFDHLSAEKNVALGLRANLKLSAEDRAVVQQALDDTGIGALGAQLAAKLSGGEQQRVALARSLVRNKPVLLLDEPFSALDQETRAEMLALVRRIVDRDQLACLMVTHDPADCEKIADRHVVMNGGKLSPI